MGALLECRKLRPELRFDGKAARAQALDKAHDNPRGDDNNEAQHGGTQDVDEAALDVQRVDQIDADDIHDSQEMPDLAEAAADPRPAGGSRHLAGDPRGDRCSVL